MPLFFNGKLVNVGSNKFSDKEGKEVSYKINTIAGPGGVLTINSQRDFSEYLNMAATIEINARQEGKLYKLSLSDISPLPVESDAEKTVE
jgi:hypothetical protein